MRVLFTQDEPDTMSTYLAELPATPLLTHEEEIELAKRIENKDDIAFNQLVQANLRLVVMLAKQYSGDKLDMIQDGNIGLMRAAQKYDWRRGYRFATYAGWWIRQGITRGLGDRGRLIRIPAHADGAMLRISRTVHTLRQDLMRHPTIEEVADVLGVEAEAITTLWRLVQAPISLSLPVGDESDDELLSCIPDESTETVEDIGINALTTQVVEDCLTDLSPREQEVISLRYGLGEAVYPHTLAEIGKIMNLSKERVRQIERDALPKLKGALEVVL